MAHADGRERIFVKFEDINRPVEVYFNINPRKTTMARLMAHFSTILGVPQWDLRFLFEGRRFGANDTAIALELENGSIVDVFHEQAPYRDTA